MKCEAHFIFFTLIFLNQGGMNLKNVHLIKGENNENVLFYYPAFELVAISNQVYAILEKIINGTPKADILHEFGISEKELDKLLDALDRSLPPLEKLEEPHKEKGKGIKRITLHVSNDCNLRCRYCYASGGNYQTSRKLMTKEGAADFLSFCLKSFDNIGGIVFFGGEPLMNIEVIDYICEKFTSLYEKKEISYLPKFSLITNGTFLNDELVRMVERYITTITVSIDGPQDINDYNRRFADGRGSYSKIAAFIREIKEKTSVRPEYEATYTPFHAEQGISEIDLKSFFKKEFDIDGTVVREMNFTGFSEDYSLRIREKESIKEESGLSFPEGFFSIVQALLYKKRKEMCLVGDHTVAISVDGDIYPCHLNTGMKNVSLGNIKGTHIFNSKEEYSKKFPYLKSIRKQNIACESCWAKGLCGGCTYQWFFDKTEGEYSSVPDAGRCEKNKKHIEHILLLITYLRRNKQKWAELLELLKTKDSSYFNG